jgi:hypothetical protein
MILFVLRPQWDHFCVMRIKCSSGKTMWLLWGIAMFWNALSWPLVFTLPRELEKGNKAIVIGLLFPAIGLGLVAAAVYVTMRYRKFGVSWLDLHGSSGVVGGYVAGLVQPGQPLLGVDLVEVRLSCMHRVVTGSGKRRHVREQLIWEDTMRLRKDSDIPFYFAIPRDVPATNDLNPRDKIIWSLGAQASLPGVDYEAGFEVPVVSSGTQLPAPEYLRDMDRYRGPETSEQTPPHTRVLFDRYAANGAEFYFPPRSATGFAVVTTLIFAGLAAGTWVAWTSSMPRMVLVVLGLFTVVVGMVTAGLWFSRSRVVFGNDEITVTRGLPGLTTRCVIAMSDVAEIKPAPNGNMGSKVYYDINLHLVTGRKIGLAGMIHSRREAQWITDRMTDCMLGWQTQDS